MCSRVDFRPEDAAGPMGEPSWQGEPQFQALFQHGAVPMALVTLGGRIEAANPAWAQFVGWEAEESAGMTLAALTGSEDEACEAEDRAALVRGEVPLLRMEKRWRHRQGHWVWADTTWSLFGLNSAPPLLLVQCQSTMALRQLRLQVAQCQARWETVMENVPEIVMKYDPLLRVVEANAAIETITRRPRQEFLGRTLEEARVPAPVEEALRNAAEQVFRTQQPAEVDYQYHSVQGVLCFRLRLIPEFEDGAIVGFLGIARDVTAEMRAPEA